MQDRDKIEDSVQETKGTGSNLERFRLILSEVTSPKNSNNEDAGEQQPVNSTLSSDQADKA